MADCGLNCGLLDCDGNEGNRRGATTESHDCRLFDLRAICLGKICSLFGVTGEESTVFHGNTHGFRIAIRQGMKPDDLKRRTKAFATEIVKFARKLPLDVASSEISRQMIKSGTAVAANYRSSCRAKSKADFISKMTTVEEEADETLLWLELLVSTETVTAAAAAALIDEADQIVRIIVTSINTARGGSR